MSKKPLHVSCVRCSGTGTIHTYYSRPCRTCVGKGWVRGLLYGERTCRKCAGEGTQMLCCSESCELCDGRGYLVKMREEGSGAEVPVPTVAYEKAGSGS